MKSALRLILVLSALALFSSPAEGHRQAQARTSLLTNLHPKPLPAPARLLGLIGEYGPETDVLLLLVSQIGIAAQRPPDDNLPKEVQGYKVRRARVKLKKTKDTEKEKEDQEIDEVLIRLGEPKLVGVSTLGVTFDLPVVLAAIKQQGDVDRLVFENMRVNDTPVTIEDYVQPFKLPNKEALTLVPPLRLFVSTPDAVLTTIDEFLNSKEVWPITGRIYVCGHYKKFLFKFKRAALVEIQSSIKNPLR